MLHFDVVVMCVCVCSFLVEMGIFFFRIFFMIYGLDVQM